MYKSILEGNLTKFIEFGCDGMGLYTRFEVTDYENNKHCLKFNYPLPTDLLETQVKLYNEEKTLGDTCDVLEVLEGKLAEVRFVAPMALNDKFCHKQI